MIKLLSGRVPIYVHHFFWFLALGIGFLNTQSILGTAIWGAIIFVSVLIHEFGHAWTALSLGQKVRIDLVALGGLTERKGPKLSLLQEFLVVMNGPLAGFLLAGVVWFLYGKVNKESIVAYALYVTYTVNFFWTVVNLFPVHPLDGGKLLRIVLEASFGVRGIKLALFVSMVTAGVVMALFFYIGFLFGGVLFMMFLFENYQGWQSSLTLTEEDRDGELQERLKKAEEAKDVEELMRVRQKAGKGVIHLAATEILASHLSGGEGYKLLKEEEEKLSPQGRRLFHKLAFQTSHWKEAIELGNRTFQDFPTYETALINALSHASLRDEKGCVGWLKCAIKEGLPNQEAIFNKTEFDPIRQTPSFRELTSS